jgi:glycosyltransferase involved in cell wall biosynthesis
MIGRIGRRLRSALAAPTVPWRRPAGEVRSLIPTLRIIARTLAAALIRAAGRSRKERRLRVGVDIRPFYESLTGVGWYLYRILDELRHEGELEIVGFGDPMLTDHGPFHSVEIPGSPEIVAFDLRGAPLSRFSRHLCSAAFPLLVWLQRCELFFGANFFLPRSLSATATRRVVTVHDLTWRRYPGVVQQETLENLERSMMREMVRADAVICVSESTRRDLLRDYPVAPERAVTIHSGIGAVTSDAAPVERLPSRYLLFVSTIEPRKDLPTLLTAFERMKDYGSYAGDLVVVGRVGWKAEAVVARMQTSRWRESIHHLDYLSREQLTTVYRQAEVFVFPSIYEGFGFPLLEAMAHETPAIASSSSSLPEVGGDAALYFPPGDSAALAERIRQLTSDRRLREEMIRRGRAQVERFHWSDAGRKTTALFRRVAGRAE